MFVCQVSKAYWSEAVPQNTFAMALVSLIRITRGILAGKFVNSVKFTCSRLLHFPLHIETDPSQLFDPVLTRKDGSG